MEYKFNPVTEYSCRFCLKTCSELTQSFTEEHAQFYHSCTGYKIPTDDCLPKRICMKCDLLLRAFVKFIKQAAVVESHLKSLKVTNESDETMGLDDGGPSDNDTIKSFDFKPNTDSDPQKIMTIKSRVRQRRQNPTASSQIAERRCYCDLCHLVYNSRIELSRHKRKFHPLPHAFQCDICGPSKTFKWKGGIKTHLLTLHKKDPENYYCDICNDGFPYRTRDKIESHMAEKHCKENGFCEKCRRYFPLNVFERHTKFYHWKMQGISICQYCGIECKPNYKLKIHIQQAHTSQELWSLSCSYCDKKFVERSKLIRHEYIHMPPRFACNICDKTFKAKRYLRLHQNVHEKRGYDCPVCAKQMYDSKVLRNHIEHHHPDVQLPAKGTTLKNFDWGSLNQ